MSVEMPERVAAPPGTTPGIPPEAPPDTLGEVDPRRSTIQAIDRAAEVLGLLERGSRLTPGQVSARLGLNRTTAHRYLQSLQHAGFLGPSLGPGPLLDQLSALVSVRRRVLDLAPAVMRPLAAATGLTAVMSVMARSGAVVALVEEPPEDRVLLTIRVGTPLAPRMAQTRVLAAFQSDAALLDRVHATLTLTQAAVEREVLVSVRRHRVAWGEDLENEAFASVAVPVFVGHEVPAAIALIGTTTTLDRTRPTGSPVGQLQEAAQALASLILG